MGGAESIAETPTVSVRQPTGCEIVCSCQGTIGSGRGRDKGFREISQKIGWTDSALGAAEALRFICRCVRVGSSVPSVPSVLVGGRGCRGWAVGGLVVLAGWARHTLECNG